MHAIYITEKINITGSFTNFTMSNLDNTLYLCGGGRGKDVTIVKPRDVSHDRYLHKSNF